MDGLVSLDRSTKTDLIWTRERLPRPKKGPSDVLDVPTSRTSLRRRRLKSDHKVGLAPAIVLGDRALAVILRSRPDGASLWIVF